MDGMFLTKEDEDRFNDWTKEQIYEAYLSEVMARQKLNEEVHRLTKRLAEIRYLVGLR